MKVPAIHHVLLALLGAPILAATAHALVTGKSIKLDFSSTASFTESDNIAGTATPSGFSAADKATIIALVQQRFDKASSTGVYKVSEGAGGDVNIIINGGTAPGTNMGKEYGDEGKPGGPGVVHVGEFMGQGFMGAGLTTGVGETAAHEAGHKLGLEHNWDNRPTLMTEGSKVTMAQRLAGNRKFNTTDSNTLNQNSSNTKSHHKDNVGLNNLLVFVGERVGPPPNFPDDRYLNCYALLNAPVGWQFGFMSSTGEFVFQGDYTNNPSNPAFMSLPYSAGLDLAVRMGSTRYKLSDGSTVATSSLSVVNPNNTAVFQQADIFFPGGVQLTLQATIDPTTGGFMNNNSNGNQIVPFQSLISGAQETPPTGSPEMGFGLLSYNTTNNTLSFNISIQSLASGEIAAHLHQGAPGVPGPIIAPLPLGNSINGTLAIPLNQVGNVLSGNTYVNFHSNAFPNGEIRGQVIIPPTTGSRLCEIGNVTMPCPCGNPPAGIGRGCDNSSATGGAVLAAMGNAFLSFDTLVFSTLCEKPTATSIVLQGTIANPVGTVFGQGIRCAGGTLKRLYTKNAVAGSIAAPSPTDQRVSQRSAALGDTITVGSNRSYLVYYRDPTVLGGCSSASTFNATETIQISWGP
jgi:hypothetical protein